MTCLLVIVPLMAMIPMMGITSQSERSKWHRRWSKGAKSPTSPPIDEDEEATEGDEAEEQQQENDNDDDASDNGGNRGGGGGNDYPNDDDNEEDEGEVLYLINLGAPPTKRFPWKLREF